MPLYENTLKTQGVASWLPMLLMPVRTRNLPSLLQSIRHDQRSGQLSLRRGVGDNQEAVSQYSLHWAIA
jgi:hypothetical protein